MKVDSAHLQQSSIPFNVEVNPMQHERCPGHIAGSSLIFGEWHINKCPMWLIFRPAEPSLHRGCRVSRVAGAARTPRIL